MLGFGKNKRKDRLIDHLYKNDTDEILYAIDVDDTFLEQPTGILEQIKKMHLSFLEVVDNVATSLVPKSLFIIEILEESVYAAIVAKKGVFLDVKYLKKYRFEELHEIYQRIVGKKVEYDKNWYESLENIITIVSYETIYTLPSNVIIVENRYSDFYKISIKSGRFKDKKVIANTLKKEFEAVSGYGFDDVYTTITQRTKKANVEELKYVVSICEKEYFDRIGRYFEESGFYLRRFHSIKSSLYSSFFPYDIESKMRIHIVDKIAYVMQKSKDEEFEYQQFNLEIDYETLELSAYGVGEVILSGSGKYYEKAKKNFVDAKISVRVFNYVKDLNRAIIRLEQGVWLDNSFASVIAVAYHELFKINFSTIRLGVSKKPTAYEYIHNNINILPFLLIVVTATVSYGMYLYLQHELDNLKLSHGDITKLDRERSELGADIKRQEKNIKEVNNRIDITQKIFDNRAVSLDAVILDEIASKLPDDMILTEIKKQNVSSGLKKGVKSETIITVKGRSFYEDSLFEYIKNINIENKNVYLQKLSDIKSKITKKEVENKQQTFISQIQDHYLKLHQEQSSTTALPRLAAGDGQSEPTTQAQSSVAVSGVNSEFIKKLKEIESLNLEEKEIYFSDTLNNEFTLEIK